MNKVKTPVFPTNRVDGPDDRMSLEDMAKQAIDRAWRNRDILADRCARRELNRVILREVRAAIASKGY